jgi:hypothetical protein
MTDILTKLRDWRPIGHPDTCCAEMVEAAHLVAQAAAEIERIETDARSLRINFMMQERDDCARIADEIAAVNDARAPKDYRDGWSCAAAIVARNIRARRD